MGVTDIDALVAAAVSDRHPPEFDVNGDGRVTAHDVDTWRLRAGERRFGPGIAYLPGDANLNGSVDTSDFNLWNAHKFAPVPAWSSGDFTVDGFVDTSDFNVWNAHKFQSAGRTAEIRPLRLDPVIHPTKAKNVATDSRRILLPLRTWGTLIVTTTKITTICGG